MDSTVAIPLLRYWLRKCGYVLADKGYDDGDIVNWIVKSLQAKAGIPIRKKNKLAKGRTFKKSIYNKRSSIERVFSILKRTYHLGKEETRGILNFAKNVYLTLICYMFKLFHIANSI